MTDIDTTAADVVDVVLGELQRAGIELAFAELKGPVKDRLRRYGLFDRIGEMRFYPTVGAAVSAYLEEKDVDWVDWEERASADGGG